jgi:hypothetical protein
MVVSSDATAYIGIEMTNRAGTVRALGALFAASARCHRVRSLVRSG